VPALPLPSLCLAGQPFVDGGCGAAWVWALLCSGQQGAGVGVEVDVLGAQLSGEGCACCRAGATADDPHVVGVAVDERDVASHLGGPEVVLVEDDVAGSGVRAYV